MSRRRIVLLAALGVPLLVFGLIVAAWAIDRARHEGQAVRGVVLAGTDVAGATRAELISVVDGLAEKVGASEVTINVGPSNGGFRISATADELGLSVDRDATVSAALASGRTDRGPAAPTRWFASLFVDRAVPVSLTLDRSKASATIGQLEGDRRKPAVEPTITPSTTGITLVPGAAGIAIDVDKVTAALPSALRSVARTIAVNAPRVETRPTVSDARVRALADAANATTKGKVTLTYGENKVEVDGTLFRPAFRVVTDTPAARLDLDTKIVEQVLSEANDTSFNATGVTFNLVDGQMVPQPGSDAIVCCGPNASTQIAAGLLDGTTTIAVDPDTITATEGVDAAAELGVKEVVGEFTTQHAAGQPRVVNIHRIADLTRGVLIAPGQTWSVNEFVGRRTKENGFVVAPVIDQGEFSEDVGGGVSQFGTTLFNAAFFAGLDIPEHKAHSIYISRYPFGREATLAFPSVDLKLTNNSPYGVVLWPTYTDRSLTVQLWSTRFTTGSQQSVTPPSGCGRITVVRDRLFVDGHRDNQKYTANYDCDPPVHN